MDLSNWLQELDNTPFNTSRKMRIAATMLLLEHLRYLKKPQTLPAEKKRYAAVVKELCEFVESLAAR